VSEPASSASEQRPRLRQAAFFYLLGLIIAGLLAGLLWHLLSSPPSYVIGDDQGAIITEQGLSQVFAMDIWYLFIGMALGFAVGAFAWGLMHQVGWPILIVVVVGALLAGLLAWQFGQLLGPRDFADRLAAASTGDRVSMDLQLHSAWLTFVWPLSACLPVAVLALWNQFRKAV